MKTKNILLIIAIVAIFISSCSQKTNNSTSNNTKETQSEEYFIVDEVLEKSESLVGKTIYVKGIVDHVCKHGGKRFKILSQEGNNEFKISLGEEFDPAEETIVGQVAYVTGKLIAQEMNAEMVKAWGKKIRENHKGEEETDHFKEEIKFVQTIHEQIISGEIPCYITYYIEADSYSVK
ncbi:MAG: hypothetical protein JEY96_18245 [Bacteroidales bacterium]|nr:hypothetical protein [Bacteroidales bacterium]